MKFPTKLIDRLRFAQGDREREPATPHPANAPVVELDVRDALRNGLEPFTRIMGAVGALGPGEVLHLRAIFEPIPLYTVLGRRGLTHEAVRHADDDWSIWFWRADEASEPARAAASPDQADALPTPAPGERWLDVRGLEPPEPMLRTLAAIEALAGDETLVQVNVRVPQLLLPMLSERGFLYAIDESRPDRVLVRIRRRDGATARTTPPPSTESRVSQPVEIDVRVIPPRDKHPTIFKTFDGLQSGESMRIINDHDPRPLRYQLMAEHPDTFEWTYEEQGPETWRVRIDRR